MNIDKLTPTAVVAELDRYIIGQKDAKRAVAVALRNRWRRQQLDSALRDEVTRSEEHTSELQSLMRISYAVFCLKKKNTKISQTSQKIYHAHYTVEETQATT